MIRFLAILSAGLALALSSFVQSAETGIIGRAYEGDAPVLYKLNTAFPSESAQAALPVLAVVAWEYDGSRNNGMPAERDLQRMQLLERLLERHAWPSATLKWAYSRTGNNRKELAYYVSSDDRFLEGLNAALAGQKRFPVEVAFSNDAAWSELKRLIDAFADES
jgi:hypothetical protein